MNKLFFHVISIIVFTISVQAQIAVPFLKKNGKYIFVDSATIKPLANTQEFDEADELEGGFWQICIGENCGLYNRFGKQLMKPKKLIFREDLQGNIFKTFQSSGSDAITGLYGLVDTTGVELVPVKYPFIWDLAEGLISFSSTNKKNGFINQKGKIVIDGITGNVYEFSNGLAKVDGSLSDGSVNQYYIDKTGKTVFKPSIKDAEWYGSFFEELILFKQKSTGLYGFINKKGKVVIQPKFQDATFFENGFAAAKLNNKYGYINKTGNFVVANEYDRAEFFEHGLGIVNKGNLRGAINVKGSVVVPIKYKDLYEFKDGLLIFDNDDTYDFYNTKGESLFSITIGDDESVGSVNNGYGIISLAKETIFINAAGKQIKIPNPPSDAFLYKTPNYIHVRYSGGTEFKNYFMSTDGKVYKQ